MQDEVKYFIAVVTKQVIERYIVTDLAAQTISPLVVDEMQPEALSEIGIAVKAYGVKGFLRILESSPLATQVRLLSQIFEVMPEGVRQELRDVVMGESGGIFYREEVM